MISYYWFTVSDYTGYINFNPETTAKTDTAFLSGFAQSRIILSFFCSHLFTSLAGGVRWFANTITQMQKPQL